MHSKTVALLGIQKQPGVGLNKHDLQSLQYPVLTYQRGDGLKLLKACDKGHNVRDSLYSRKDKMILKFSCLKGNFEGRVFGLGICTFNASFLGRSLEQCFFWLSTSRLREGYAEALRNVGWPARRIISPQLPTQRLRGPTRTGRQPAGAFAVKNAFKNNGSFEHSEAAGRWPQQARSAIFTVSSPSISERRWSQTFEGLR